MLAEVQRLKAEASRMVTTHFLFNPLTVQLRRVYSTSSFLSKFNLSDQVAILAMEAEEENLSEEKKLSLGQEVR